MNTWKIEKGKKIIKIVYEYQKKKGDIGFRELVRQSGLSKRGLEMWLTHLREEIWSNGSRKISIVRKEPRIPILLTDEALESYEKDTLILRNHSKNKLTDRQLKTILLILSIAVRGRIKLKRIYQTQSHSRSLVKSLENREFQYVTRRRIPGVAITDIVYKYKNYKKKNKSSLLRAGLLENRINPFNMDLFGFLELSIDEARKSMKFLTQYEPPILREKKYHNQTRYIFENEELRKFIDMCIVVFCQDVHPLLEYFYSLNESILKAREKRDLEFFEKSPCPYIGMSKEELIAKNKEIKKSKLVHITNFGYQENLSKIAKNIQIKSKILRSI